MLGKLLNKYDLKEKEINMSLEGKSFVKQCFFEK